MAVLEIEHLGQAWGWRRGSGDWAGVQAAIDRQAPVQVMQEAGSTQWQSQLPPDHTFSFLPPEDAATYPDLAPPPPQAQIWISPMQRSFLPDALLLKSTLPKVQWHPRVLWVGIGCNQGIQRSQIDYAIHTILRAHHLAKAAIAGLATIDTKAQEPELISFCSDREIFLHLFSADQLRTIAVPTPSDRVQSKANTPSVAEAAAILASGGEAGEGCAWLSRLFAGKMDR
ncbi:MAG: cobalamin biosynthesis protein CbiG [Leptolyngbyaceae cyanobacterium CSU_1_3]|nr:cobalamin biosynthesis protein CbiG [Leptolyngbyaceae cyanobacterium CSU_1_3]